MQILHESKITDSASNLRAAFRKNGYLFIRAFFPSSLIILLRERIIRVLEAENWGRFEAGTFIAIGPTSNRINSPSFHRCIAILMQEEALHEISQQPSLYSFLSTLLEEPIYPHHI